MIIPKELIIGENIYNIKMVKVVDRFNNNISGDINYGNKLMKIKKQKNNPRSEEDVLFHEIAHGLIKELEFNYPKITIFRSNENFIQELGLLLRKTFIDLLEKQKCATK